MCSNDVSFRIGSLDLLAFILHRTHVYDNGVHVPWRFALFPARLLGSLGDVCRVFRPSLQVICPAALLQGLAEHGHQGSQWYEILADRKVS